MANDNTESAKSRFIFDKNDSDSGQAFVELFLPFDSSGLNGLKTVDNRVIRNMDDVILVNESLVRLEKDDKAVTFSYNQPL